LKYTVDNFRRNDNLETLWSAFNISQMHDTLYCCLRRSGNLSCLWQHTPVVAWVLREI